MIVPHLQHQALLADIQAARQTNDGFRIWWLGQSGFLLQWQNQHLLFDPYLSDSLTVKYANTDKPHVRMTELAIDPRQLNFLDTVTSSHNHTDHLDGETLTALLDVNTSLHLVVPAANQQFAAERLGIEPQRLIPITDGDSLELDGFRLHAVPAAHNLVDRDEQGRCRYLGYVAQFGPYTVYHSGDTMMYDGMVDALSSWAIDVALLPINGYLPERRVAGNLWGREAAQLAHDIGAKLVIPCHYDMFTFNTETTEEFITKATELGQPYRVLLCGERYSHSE
ncbi:MAG TPA: hypothetical protein DCY79_10505 [Planctomycetaceae bacterium]|nr:hypothetical protein [Blastopirellula sp.]HAY80224.1 hypothetical protein [Planctomycetaceae bacterium]